MRRHTSEAGHLMLLLTLCHVTCVCVQSRLAPSQDPGVCTCQTSRDLVYGGNLVDCSGLGMQEVPAGQLPHKVTTLLLQDNNITSLANNSFLVPQLTSLRHLNIRASGVASIEVDALSGLWNLETLDLEHNNLELCQNKRSFPAGMFKHVPNLRHLFIGFNTADGEVSPRCQGYSQHIDIFSSLPRLRNLSIDALNDTLHLGREFAQLTALENVTVSCSCVQYLTNDSLRGLWQLPLRALSLVNFQREIITFELGLFQNLPNLIHLTVDDSHIGNHNILRAVNALANRTMTSLYFRKTNVFATYSVPSVALKDGIIGDELSKSLRSICLRHFSWIDSILFAFKPKSLTTGAFSDCITSIDLSRNKLGNVGWVPVLFETMLLKLLQEVTLSSVESPLAEGYPRLVNFSLPADDSNHDVSGQQDVHNCTDKAAASNNIGILSDFSSQAFPHSNNMGILSDFSSQAFPHNGNLPQQTLEPGGQVSSRTGNGKKHWEMILPGHKQQADYRQQSKFPYNGNITYYFPPSLRRLKIINMIFAPLTIGSLHIVCASNDNFQELYWVNNQLMEAKGVISGVERLKLLDISGSVFDIADHLFDTFSGLQVFLLRQVKPDTFFQSISIQRLLRNLTRLRYLDVSNNRLNSLLFPVDTFSSTADISHVILSQNRFSNIPFDLETTPNLRLLDLSGNAILFLSDHEMLALDRHVSRVDSLTLRLQDNAIACVCSQIGFMVWMLTTQVTIQQSAPFQCLAEDGPSVEVSDLEDIPIFCRVCRGRLFLMAALILTSLVVIAFLSAYLATRFRTAIVAFLGKLLTRPLGPEDYQFGVFIGYADDDHRFAINVLMKYLEDGCHLVTYVPDRDLGAGYRMELLDQAIHDSWRVLLVLSRSFLHNYDISEILMKLACHSVTAMNRKRLFVLVEKDQVHAIPCDLYDVLDETRIILFEDFHHQLDYQQQQRIKYCLR